MLDDIQIQPDGIELLKMKLRTMLECLENGIPFGVTGSPLSSLLSVQSDFLAILKEVIEENKGERRNPEIRFEEFQRCLEPTEGFLDVEKQTFYKPSIDPLGNPLQVQIDLGKSFQFTLQDCSLLLQFIEHIEEFFSLLASGKFEGKFIKIFLEALQPKITSLRYKEIEPQKDAEQKAIAQRAKEQEQRKAASIRKQWKRQVDWLKRNSLPQSCYIEKAMEKVDEIQSIQDIQRLERPEELTIVKSDLGGQSLIKEILENASSSTPYELFKFLNREWILISNMTPEEIQEYEKKIKYIRNTWHSNKKVINGDY